MKETQGTRRRFLKTAGFAAVASAAGVDRSFARRRTPATPRPDKIQFHLGLASYTLRKFKLDDVLAMTKRVGLKYIAFKDFHLPMNSTPEQARDVVEKVKKAGLTLYGGGVIYMKTEAEVHRAFDYAKAAGIKTIIGVPQPQLLPLVNEKVREYDISVAIHNHGPGDKTYPTPASAYERIKSLDRRIGLCNDVGHTKRAGVDPSESISKYADRLLDVHMKDVSEATARGRGVEVGRGVIDIPRLVRTLVKIGYKGILAFEYEKDADDPLPGLAESVGYVKGVIAAV